MDIARLIAKYKSLEIEKAIDFEKFNHILLTHHSTAIEGSTLTQMETTVLLNDGLTPPGKPLAHALMVKDHLHALEFVLKHAQKKTPLSVPVLQQIAGRVLQHTGSVYRTPLGDVDSTKGEFRKGNVYVGASYFPAYDKVPALAADLLDHIQTKLQANLTLDAQLTLSFDAHFHLVSIHPFYDGNGRTSRLMMNYIQRYYDLPLGIVPVTARADYFQALVDARKHEDVAIFQGFMETIYANQLAQEIEAFETATQRPESRRPLWRQD